MKVLYLINPEKGALGKTAFEGKTEDELFQVGDPIGLIADEKYATERGIETGAVALITEPSVLQPMLQLMDLVSGGAALVEDSDGNTYTYEQFGTLVASNPLYVAKRK